jgi:hypothetical protein
MLSRNEVTIVGEKGPATIAESSFDPSFMRLARGSRIPAVAAVYLGTTADSVLNSVAGDPELADAPGLVPVARNPPSRNLPGNTGGAHGSTNAISEAENNQLPATAIGDAAKANPENPKVAKKEELIDNGQIFTARFKGGKYGVVTSHGEPLSDDRYDDPNAAVAAFAHPTKHHK